MKDFESSKILVFGGAGFIGSNFIRHILSEEHPEKLVNFDKLTYSGNPDNLREITSDPAYEFMRDDIADYRAVEATIKKYKPQYIINFAAETHVDRSIHVGARDFIRTNTEGVFNVLEAIKNIGGVKKFVQVSTDEVYGSLDLNSKRKFKEGDELKPNSPYAASKASGDLWCRAYYSTWNTPVVVTRCANNFGAYQYPEKLIPFFILRMLTGQKLPLYGTGENIRDWIHVLDHCQALKLCLLSGRPGDIYNIGAGNEKTNIEMAKMILAHFNKDESHIEFVTDRPGHDLRYGINTDKIRTELGWEPGYNFNIGFSQTIRWYIDNRSWVEKIYNKTDDINAHIKNLNKDKYKN
ncbi:dTDP-glucose 4,6-dehydratase [Candidatus Azambacteria bacterium RIFCSPHIGHO2_01_FULL_44_55]|uniref:dTDP-glucose 4,6-dehydratase n=1 Tax=Candidatus Azambacteria bacterium RIFCSPLOWO2_02_FULL_44_14 TaxID=1797306 RepID=A0A1F5CD66_9BACT|nr:MAG: dTDP-glucose 4,6-dehydratase [Candidatus Azambacteria bacterium RIFCSPLOWO2_01_FULL_44_84]OGD33357.1 MAG: dTDP-glucose 4,6-dehydratase [Candidatus Azambacteria bacterium RIFCSPHIGHO2_02_FULL_45_18]OGD40668.1 MAG: dTDP-glucose 4,6-dehydratase [Candidatus Azambacteria bacterium RIFCSPHIGHO2_01_FULL_44_55]OGD40782.1 MAG: dTDP-glucose 4,6-dehydratase [Candidatus Azambacteria bacterium RIFCSPLOWO2_02_FULL_44_14]